MPEQPTGKQRAAIADLELAFKKCRRTGLRFFAMDSNFYACIGKDYDQSADFHSQYSEDQKWNETIDTHGTFIDSGGW